MKINELIYTRQRRRKLNTAELANLIGVRPETLRNWYHEKCITLTTLDKIAEVLACRWSLVPIATDLTAENLAEVEETMNPQNWKEYNYLKALQKSKRKGMVTYKYSQKRDKALKDDAILIIGIIANKKLIHHRVTTLGNLAAARKNLAETYNIPVEKVAVYAAELDAKTRSLRKGKRKLTEPELYCAENSSEKAEN